MTYKVNAKAESTQIDIINAFRKQTLHQESRKAGQYNDHDGTKEIPIIYPISKVLFPEVNSWDGHVFLPGFFFLEEEEERLSGELEDFIQRGPRPIAVTFSSMPMVNPKRFLENLHGALMETGNRAIVLTGNSGMACENDAYLYAMPALSHQLLFSQVKGVIHHGGVGTMSTALKAGIPQLIIPFSVDQPFWAQRLYQLGIGLKPLREKTATKEALVKAIQQMDAMKQRDAASAIANAVRNENGVQKTVRYLENIYNKKDGL